MMSFLMSLMCITGLHNATQCPTQTPISKHKLDGIWNPSNPYEYISSQYKPYYSPMNKTLDLKALSGKKLKIAVILDPPYVNESLRSSPNEPIYNLTGDAYEVLKVLKKALEFEYELVSPSDGSVGIYNEKEGTWNGIMGMLVSGEADLSIHMMSMLSIRARDVRFSKPLGQEKWVIMMQRPDQTTDGDGLTIPFQREVWYCLVALVLFMFPLSYIMVRIRTRACRNIPGLSDGYSFGKCVWFIYGALLKQGSVLKPVADSTRILFVSWWMFITILTGFYTANLTAYLTLSKVHIPYNGLETIPYRKYWTARQSDTIHQMLAIGSSKNGTGDDVVYKISPPYPEFKNLRWADEKRYGSYESTLTDMVERVRKRDELMFEEESRVLRVIYSDFRNMTRKQTVLQKRCKFMKSIIPIFEVPYGFAFSPKRADEILPVFGAILDKMTEFGMWDYYRQLGIPVRDPCDKEDKDFRERKMRNGDLMKTYIICLSGYGLAFVTFLIEQLHRCFFKPKATIHFYKDAGLQNKMFSFNKGKGGIHFPIQRISVATIGGAGNTKSGTLGIEGSTDPRFTSGYDDGLTGLQPAYFTYRS